MITIILRRLALALAVLFAVSPAGAATRTATVTGNWANTATWGGAAAPVAGDVAIINSSIVVTVADGTTATVGTSGPTSPTAAPTWAATGGGSTTSLPTGNYIVSYSYVDAGGLESSPSPPTGALALTNGTSTPLITFPALPGTAASRNVYITNTGGAAGTEHLYATGVATLTSNPTSASWNNGTQTYAAAAPTPLSSAVTVLGSGKLIVGSTTGATLNVRGDLLLGQTSTGRNTGFYALTLNPGSTLAFDGSHAGTPASAKYVCGPTQSNSPDSRVQCLGTTGSHCTVNSNASGGNAWFSNRGFNTRLGSMTATFTDFTRIGDATNDGWQLYFSSGTTEPDTLSLHDCTITASGRINNLVNTNSAAVISLQRVTTSSSAGTTPIVLAGSNGLTTGTAEMLQCSFDTNVTLANPRQWNIGSPSDATKGNYFGGGFTASGSGTSVWNCFNGNFINNAYISSSIIKVYGNVTNSYCFQNAPGHSNPDTFQHPTALAAGTYSVTGNLFEFNGTDGTGDFLDAPAGGSTNAVTFNVAFNLILPTPSFPTSGWNTSGKLFGALGGTNQTIRLDHNTCPSGGGDSAAIYIGDSFNPATGYLSSVQGNLFWDNQTPRSNALFNRHDTGSDNGNVVAPGSCNYNGSWNQSITVNPGSGTAASTIYGCLMSGSAPGANDVAGNPSFVDNTRRLRTWGTSVGADGTDAGALAKLAANPALISSAIAWVQAGWRPTNTSFKSVTGTLDTAQSYTLDAAGNSLNGTVGALAWITASNPVPIINGGIRRRAELILPMKLDALFDERRRRRGKAA
jgi:hypothetical protein